MQTLPALGGQAGDGNLMALPARLHERRRRPGHARIIVPLVLVERVLTALLSLEVWCDCGRKLTLLMAEQPWVLACPCGRNMSVALRLVTWEQGA